uniref:Sulfhydryl oxidase n=1 Tax=Mimivirus LCMiAC01 TaxID=2506608 RepID=A0A481Z082_9VIRU|nr:MAG: disulfide (thiol) oxidoreductase, Erv1 / Alr family [Mimivirus LCMiAC01]
MDPKIWGSHAWMFLHCITIGYPKCPSDTDKKNIKTFFENLHTILPCEKCKDHFKEHFLKYPLTNEILCSKKKLFRWLVDVRNSVNRQLNKPEISYESVLNKCTTCNKTTTNRTKYIMYILVFIAIILIVIIMCRFMKRYGLAQLTK